MSAGCFRSLTWRSSALALLALLTLVIGWPAPETAFARAAPSGRIPPASAGFADCRGCPQMVVVPAGAFVMGSPPDEKYRGAEDQHRVVIAKPFAVSRYEITFDQWQACRRERACDSRTPDDEGWGRGRRPVIYMNYFDAKAYVGWLRKKTGKPYRLLSEAEWEYAARAGSTGPFAFGPRITSAQVNFDASSKTELNPKGLNRRKSLPVGSFKPNAFGLYDMHGNVWEWTEDCWHDEYTGAPTDGSPWAAVDCSGRVLRGGSWEDSVSDIRVGARVSNTDVESSYADGLRVALDLP